MSQTKLVVYLDGEELKLIEHLQKASGAISKAAVLKEALGFYSWADKQILEGYQVCSIKDGEPLREVLLFRARRNV